MKWLVIITVTIALTLVAVYSIREYVYYFNKTHWLDLALAEKYELFPIEVSGNEYDYAILHTNGMLIRENEMAIVVQIDGITYVQKREFDYLLSRSLITGGIQNPHPEIVNISQIINLNGVNGLTQYGFVKMDRLTSR